MFLFKISSCRVPSDVSTMDIYLVGPSFRKLIANDLSYTDDQFKVHCGYLCSLPLFKDKMDDGSDCYDQYHNTAHNDNYLLVIKRLVYIYRCTAIWVFRVDI